MLRGEQPAPDTSGSEFDLASVVADVRLGDLEVAATAADARRMGFEPGWQFATWECRRR